MTAGCVVGLVLIVVALLIAGGTLVVCLIHEHREQGERIARRQIVASAEQELRESTHATMQSMRDVLRDHLRS